MRHAVGVEFDYKREVQLCLVGMLSPRRRVKMLSTRIASEAPA